MRQCPARTFCSANSRIWSVTKSSYSAGEAGIRRMVGRDIVKDKGNRHEVSFGRDPVSSGHSRSRVRPSAACDRPFDDFESRRYDVELSQLSQFDEARVRRVAPGIRFASDEETEEVHEDVVPADSAFLLLDEIPDGDHLDGADVDRGLLAGLPDHGLFHRFSDLDRASGYAPPTLVRRVSSANEQDLRPAEHNRADRRDGALREFVPVHLLRKRKPTPSTLRRLRNVAARVDHRIVVEGPLIEDVLKDLAHPNIAFHRDVEACSEMIQGRLHRREEVWRLSERGPDMLPDVPHADRHDVARMRLPKDDRGSLAPFPLQGFPDCESGRVVAPANARVRGAALEALVVAEEDDLPPQRVPQRVRVPGLDQFVAPRSRDHHDEEPIIKADRLEDSNVVDQWECLHHLPQVLPDRVVHGGDRPPCRDETAVLLDAKRSDTECALDLRHRETASIHVEHGLLRAQVRIRAGPVQIPVDLQRADVEPAQRCGGPKRLDVVIEYDPSAGLALKSDFHVRRDRSECELAGEVDDPSSRSTSITCTLCIPRTNVDRNRTMSSMERPTHSSGASRIWVSPWTGGTKGPTNTFG